MHAATIASLIVLTSWLTGVVALVTWGRMRRRVPRVSAIIVPGCRVYPDGTPSPALSRRVNLAVSCWARCPEASIIVSGHRGEAETGARLAAEAGVPATKLRVEPEASNTLENAVFSLRMVDPEARVLVCTDDYHALRSQLLFRGVHHAVTTLGARSSRFPWWYATRECISIALIWARRRP